MKKWATRLMPGIIVVLALVVGKLLLDRKLQELWSIPAADAPQAEQPQRGPSLGTVLMTGLREVHRAKRETIAACAADREAVLAALGRVELRVLNRMARAEQVGVRLPGRIALIRDEDLAVAHAGWPGSAMIVTPAGWPGSSMTVTPAERRRL